MEEALGSRETESTSMLSLLSSGKHSDVTFVVQGEHIKAHAAILSARSDVFDRLLDCGMR